MNRSKVAAFAILAVTLSATSSQAQFTRQDTLRGSITPERAWWDLTYYHLDVKIDPIEKTVEGSNTVQYRVIEPDRSMQIDLQEPMHIDAVEQDGKPLMFERFENVYYIILNEEQEPGSVHELRIDYGGQPKVSSNPPWDGGFTWTKDDNGYDFIATSVQGEGASLWWPCKDHMYDEPDSMLISVTVPIPLSDISNGRLRSIEEHDDGTQTFTWFVDNPINNYGVNVNIGDYVHWSEVYDGEKGPLDLDFYVLSNDLPKARLQFKQAHAMLRAFEHWFGPYPFYEDGYKLVQTPYLGMEHQSSVTYGNEFRNGYRGRDLSRTGWGLLWDYIIIHESGHEWFANSITYKDIADMWIHEGFTTYSEDLFVDYHYGTRAAEEYIVGIRNNIRNDKPIIGHYGVNEMGSGDMYPKGANMLHMIRQLVNDDEKWRQVLRGLNETFYHQTVTTHQIEQYIIDQTGLDLQPVFDQYLRDVRIPTLEYKWADNTLNFRWGNAIDTFDMPVEVEIDGTPHTLHPTTEWQSQAFDTAGPVALNPNYYVGIENPL